MQFLKAPTDKVTALNPINVYFFLYIFAKFVNLLLETAVLFT